MSCTASLKYKEWKKIHMYIVYKFTPRFVKGAIKVLMAHY